MTIYNQINTKINTIAKIISSHDYNPNDFEILGGNSGIMLFLLYYSKFSKSEEAYNYSLDILEKTILKILTKASDKN